MSSQDLPRSQHMLSHLNSDRAINDYIARDARKLVSQQEEFIRRLSKIRRQMESSEEEIGKVNDYYRGGSGGDLYTFTLDKAAKRSKARSDKKEKLFKEITLNPSASATEPKDYLEDISPSKGKRLDIEPDDFETSKFDDEIKRLRRRVANLAIKSKQCNEDGVSAPTAVFTVPVDDHHPRGYQDLYTAGGEVLSGYYREEDYEYPAAITV